MKLTNADDLSTLYDIAKQIVDAYRTNLEKDGYDPNGNLVNFKWTVQFENNTFLLKFMIPKEWKWAEFGREPGPYPLNSNRGLGWVKSIKNWIAVKNIAPKNPKNLPQDKAREQMAWAITKKIQKEGFQGKHSLTRTLFEEDAVIEALATEMTKILGTEITDDLIHIADGLQTISTVSKE